MGRSEVHATLLAALVAATGTDGGTTAAVADGDPTPPGQFQQSITL